MAQGWVCVHRQLLDNPIFKNDKMFRVFMFCLLRAQHTSGDQLVGDSVVHLKAGQLATGRIAISDKTGLSQQNVRTAISKLEKLGILTIKPTTKYSVITMSNWDKYQQANQQVTSKQPTSNQQVTTSNNDNNENNENKPSDQSKIARDELIESSFSYWWKSYPTKTARKAAFKKWQSITKKMDDNIVTELTNHIVADVAFRLDGLAKGDDRFIGFDRLHPTTYLNQERYNDDF